MSETEMNTGPKAGNVWIVFRLAQTTKARAEEFEQRALVARMHWDSFWVKPETPNVWRGIFELSEGLYECDGHQVELVRPDGDTTTRGR